MRIPSRDQINAIVRTLHLLSAGAHEDLTVAADAALMIQELHRELERMQRTKKKEVA